MFDIFIRKISGEIRNHHDVRNISITTSRVLLGFKDNSYCKYIPAEIEEIKVLSNVRRVNAWDS